MAEAANEGKRPLHTCWRNRRRDSGGPATKNQGIKSRDNTPILQCACARDCCSAGTENHLAQRGLACSGHVASVRSSCRAEPILRCSFFSTSWLRRSHAGRRSRRSLFFGGSGSSLTDCGRSSAAWLARTASVCRCNSRSKYSITMFTSVATDNRKLLSS